MEHSYPVRIVVKHFETALTSFFLRTCIHKILFARLSESSPGCVSSAMTALAQSPAIDVIGVGFASGEISIYDIRADEKIMRIFVREGPVRALAFHGGKGPNISVSRSFIPFRWTGTCLCLGNGAYIPLGS